MTSISASDVMERLDTQPGIRIIAVGSRWNARGQKYVPVSNGHTTKALDKYNGPVLYVRTEDGNIYCISNGTIKDANGRSEVALKDSERKSLIIRVGKPINYSGQKSRTAPVSEIVAFSKFKVPKGATDEDLQPNSIFQTTIGTDFNRKWRLMQLRRD